MAQPISFEDFILGGLADSPYYGAKNSLAEIVGFDMHSQPGKLLVNQKLTKDSPASPDADEVTEFCKVGVPLSDGSSIWFSSTSGKIWREVAGAWTLLGTLEFPAFDLLTAAYTTKSKTVDGQVNIPTAMQFNNDGTILYIMANATVSGNNGEIFQYTLSTAYDITTATYASKKFNADLNGIAFFLNTDGTKLYVTEDNGGTSVIRYNLSTAWDISTAAAASNTFNFSATGDRCTGISMNTTGTKMFLFFYDALVVAEYTLGTAWDLTTASLVDTFAITNPLIYSGFYVKQDGTKMFYVTIDYVVKSYNLGTAWDLDTVVDTGRTYDIDNSGITGAGGFFGLTFAHNGSGFYVGGQNDPETVYQFSLGAEDLNVQVLDAAEHDGSLFYATKNRVRSVPIASITSILTASVGVGTFTNGDADYHPMVRLNGILYIGDGNLIAQVEDSVFTANALDIVSPLRVSALGVYDVELLIGTIVSSNVMQSQLIRWNTWSDSWQYADPIPEVGINAFLETDNEVVVSAGTKGHIYTYNGVQLVSKKKLPGSFVRGSTDECRVFFRSVLNYEGVALFGVSQVTGNSISYGIYSYARRSAGYPYVFALEYVISPNTLQNAKIGAIVSSSNGFLVAWNTGSSYGVDRLDLTAKYTSPYLVTRYIIADRLEPTVFGQLDVAYAALPTNTDIVIQKKLDAESSFSTVPSVVDAKRLLKSTTVDIGSMVRGQIKISCVVSGNNAPEIEGFFLDPNTD